MNSIEDKNIKETHEDDNYQTLDFDNFDDFLKDCHGGNLLRGIYSYGFEKPSPIQAKAILPILDEKDLIAQAQSGSGKTGAFVIGSIGRIDPKLCHPQVMIISNTRDLATQIASVATNISSYIGIKISLCIGGLTGKDVTSNLKEAYNSHMLVGTPGRLVDLSNRDYNKKHLLGMLKLLVLDEADALLDNDFKEQIYKIFQKIPKSAKVSLFSATFSPAILDITKKFMTNPVKILVEPEKVSVTEIKNFFVGVGNEDSKYDVLVELYQKVSICQTVIFVNTIKKASMISDRLKYDGHAVGTIHAQLNDIERSEILKNFRRSTIRVLVATDLIARGIDVQQVGLVINYDVPYEAEHYIHRAGRSGRYGKSGIAITFITNNYSDFSRMGNIENKFGIVFSRLPSLATVNHYLTGMKGYSFVDQKNI